LTLELSIKHPGFYRYTSKVQFTEFNDSIKASIRDSLTELESYLKLKAVVGKIHCLHTGITLPAQYVTYLNNQPNLIPLKIWFKNNRAFIAENFSGNDGLLPGDEIISINRHSVEQILNQLLALIPSDGFNLTLKYRALYLQFPTWYRLMDAEEKFTVVVSRKGLLSTVELIGKKYNLLAGDDFLKEPERLKQLEFKIDGEIAVLTIHSFAKTNIEKGGQHFRPFIENVFSELERNHIQHFIVDLRDNNGGSDPNAVFFTSYFFDKPFRYWDRIEVTEAIAKQIKGPKLKAFYRVPVQKDSIWLWQKGRFTNEFDFYTEQLPAKKPWRGKTYILMNGFSMSSCADVIAVLSFNKKATLIGEETGGAYEGNNSGMIPETSVDPFHFTLTVPLQKFYNAVDLSNRQGRGVLPDYPVNPDLKDIIGGEDLYMKKLTELKVTETGYKN
jgi:C-terminal processing protease CtpA/Prc